MSDPWLTCAQNWKVRKEGYEDAAKTFESTPDETDPAFRPFTLDSGLWKGAVLDSNVAAQQEGVGALCAFLKFGGLQACTRSAVGYKINENWQRLIPLQIPKRYNHATG